MSKFEHQLMFRELNIIEESCFVINRNKYSLEDALKLAKIEYKETYDDLKHINLSINTSYVSHGYYLNYDGEKENGYHMKDIFQKEKKTRNEIPVYVFIPINWHMEDQ